MRISVGTTLWRTQNHPDTPPGGDPWPSEIAHLLWQAKVADDGGFENIWLTEHHFAPQAAGSAPSVILSHMAAITKRVRIGYGVALLPLQHPVRLASEMLWVDQLSHGRLNVGVGRGHTNLEFAAFGGNHETERQSFVEALTILRAALQGDPFEMTGEVWQTPYLRIIPPPYQKPSPPLHLVTTSEWSMRQAVAFGAAPILGVDAPADLKAQLDTFRRLASDADLPEETIDALCGLAKCTRRIVVAESRAEAEEEVLRGIAEADAAWTRYSKPADDRSFFDPWEPAVPRQDVQSPGMPGHTLVHVICGTPDDVVEQIRALEAETGLHHVSTTISSHGIDRAFCERQVKLMVESVIPRVA